MTEKVLEAKVIELASDMGVILKSEEISVTHRLGRSRLQDRDRFCLRKKRRKILKRKTELKKKQRQVFVNEDLTRLRSAMLNIVKEQQSVKNITIRDGKIVAWLKDNPERPVFVDTPDDLVKIGVAAPD